MTMILLTGKLKDRTERAESAECADEQRAA
jgi:hypothetical protein